MLIFVEEMSWLIFEVVWMHWSQIIIIVVEVCIEDTWLLCKKENKKNINKRDFYIHLAIFPY